MTKVLLIDNYDSFTYNLKDYLAQAGLQLEVYRNDEISIDQIKEAKYTGLVLSPGPGKPSEVPLLHKLIDYSITEHIPLLGICLGHQAIGEYFGLQTRKAPLPVHGKTDDITLQSDHPVFDGIKAPITVMRYHSLIVEGQSNHLRVIAKNKEGINMAMVHNSKPLFSMQFHPESVLTKDGLQMLHNWANHYIHEKK